MQARDKTTDDLACMGIAMSQDHHLIEVMHGDDAWVLEEVDVTGLT